MEMFVPSFGPPFLNGEVLPFNVAALAHAEAKCVKEMAIRGRGFCSEEPDLPHPPGRLRLGSERRDDDAGGACDERASVHHWMISSARASNDCGMVSPSALAVLRLITSSNLFGCSIGRWDGLSPLGMLST